MNILHNIAEKILFLDKFIYKTLKTPSIGLVKLNGIYYLDIPKSGSSTIKHYIAEKSKRYIFSRKYLNFNPVHTCVKLEEKKNLETKIDAIYGFIRDPVERIYSVYKQKVLNKGEFPIGYRLIKQKNLGKLSTLDSLSNYTDSFSEFYNKIGNLCLDSTKYGYDISKILDKHILPQTEIIKTIIKNYNLNNRTNLVLFSLSKMNSVLNKNDNNFVLNSTNKSNFYQDFDQDFKNKTNKIYKNDENIFREISTNKNLNLNISIKEFNKKFANL